MKKIIAIALALTLILSLSPEMAEKNLIYHAVDSLFLFGVYVQFIRKCSCTKYPFRPENGECYH